jgi:N-acetylglutamate synthase-like GNAT family acetyltransferase
VCVRCPSPHTAFLVAHILVQTKLSNEGFIMTRTATPVRVEREDPWCHDARVLLDELGALLALTSGSSGQSRFFMEEVCSVRGSFLLARTPDGQAVGCGGFRRYDYGVAELKRIYGRSSNGGVGASLLMHLEERATTAGYHTLIVNTGLAGSRARSFFWRSGFLPTLAFGGHGADPREFIMEKRLAG